MLTIFSIPRAFEGDIGIAQRNSVQSWARLGPSCEIILCAEEEGTEEIASQIGAKYVPDVARNEFGTPLIDSAFSQARDLASNDLMCFVNTDIILFGDFLKAIKRVRKSNFLMIGQRWDLDLTESLDFDQPDWDDQLRARVAREGVLHPPAGSDYFVFGRDTPLASPPPFAIGRGAWDNWFIYKARDSGMPVVDASQSVTAVHQNHDYSHFVNQREGHEEHWKNAPEVDVNRSIRGTPDNRFTIDDATHVLTPKKLVPALGTRFLKRRWQTLPVLYPRTKPLFNLLFKLLYAARHPFRTLRRVFG